MEPEFHRYISAYWLRPVTGVFRALESAFFRFDQVPIETEMIDLGVGDGVYSSLAVGVDAASLNPYAHIASSPDTARLDDQGLPDMHLSVPDDDQVLKEIRSTGVHRVGQGRWMLGVDHKPELLARAAATGAFRNLVMQDFNDPELALHGFEPVDLTFSNCLYWAHDPARVLRAIRTWASDGGQVWLSVMLDNYAEHLIWTTMSDFPTLRPALDRGRHSHYAVSWNADRWLETVRGAGFEVFDYKFAASPSLVTANEWLDLREVYPFIARMASLAEPSTLEVIKQDWISHLSNLASLAWRDGAFTTDASNGTYLLIKAKTN